MTIQDITQPLHSAHSRYMRSINRDAMDGYDPDLMSVYSGPESELIEFACTLGFQVSTRINTRTRWQEHESDCLLITKPEHPVEVETAGKGNWVMVIVNPYCNVTVAQRAEIIAGRG